MDEMSGVQAKQELAEARNTMAQLRKNQTIQAEAPRRMEQPQRIWE
jgi:hypothetical protein